MCESDFLLTYSKHVQCLIGMDYSKHFLVTVAPSTSMTPVCLFHASMVSFCSKWPHFSFLFFSMCVCVCLSCSVTVKITHVYHFSSLPGTYAADYKANILVPKSIVLEVTCLYWTSKHLKGERTVDFIKSWASGSPRSTQAFLVWTETFLFIVKQSH